MVSFADVATYFGASSDSQTAITGMCSSDKPRPHSVTFIRTWDSTHEQTTRTNPTTLFICPPEAPESAEAADAHNIIRVDNPRLAYAQLVRDLLHVRESTGVMDSAVVDPTAHVGENVSIGHFCVVGANVSIGAGSTLGSHCVLYEGVTLGENCTVGSHVTIGGPGFGFEMDETGRPVRIGHVGGVVIGNDVEIGQQVSIAQGTIEPTRIDDHVKIDDCVFIAHNVRVGENTFVIAGAEVSGSVTIGKRVWISPEAAITNKASIGDDALVGIGAVVVGDVEANTVVAGVPAKFRRKRFDRP